MFDLLEDLVSESKIENGVWVHLHTYDENQERVPLYYTRDGKPSVEPTEFPARALVRSADSKAVQAIQRKLQAKAAIANQRRKQGDVADLMVKQTEVGEPLVFAATLVALENCSTDSIGRVHNMSEAESIEMHGRPNLQSFVRQIVIASNDPSRYAPDGEVEKAGGEDEGAGGNAQTGKKVKDSPAR